MASSSVKWMPPLRDMISGRKREIISMEISQAEPSGSDESLPDGNIVVMNLEYCVDFVSDVPDPRLKNFRGLAIQHCLSATNLNYIIEYVQAKGYFPVPGKSITWTEKHCDGDLKSEVLKNTGRGRILPRKIRGFRKEAMEKEYNKGTKNVHLKLKIIQENVITDVQLINWHGWYAEMAQIVPGFEQVWSHDISRPRTEEELNNETRYPLVPRFDWEFEKWRGKSCPICLDEFSVLPNCRAVKPPCGHMFHKNCITKWFYIGPLGIKCPTCRSDIPRFQHLADPQKLPSSLLDYLDCRPLPAHWNDWKVKK